MKKQSRQSLSPKMRDRNAILQYRDYILKELKKLDEKIKNTTIPDYQKNCIHQWYIFKTDYPGITGNIKTFKYPYCEKCGLGKNYYDKYINYENRLSEDHH